MIKPALPFSWNRDLVWGLLLVAATLLAYQPAWNGQPVWDDDANITSPVLRSAHGLWRIWTEIGATPQQYYPLLHTVFWTAHRVWGERWNGYHLLNILLHVFSALILVRILRKLDVPGARFAGFIFALHPVMVESVAWMTELKNTLSGVFFLGAALAYVQWNGSRRQRYYLVALGLFVLGLLSKTAIVPFPLAMLAVVWWKRGTIAWRRDVLPLLPFFAVAAAMGLVTLHMERDMGGAKGALYDFSLVDRVLIAGRAFWFYLGKVFFPVHLIFIYPRWSVSAGEWWQYLFPVGVLAAGGALWAARSRWRAPLAVFLYFGAMLLPVAGFLNLYAFRYSFVADHWQYLASIGPIAAGAACIVQGTGLLKERLRRLLQPLLYGLLPSVLFLLSWSQSRMYSDIETLYRTTIRKNPDCWMAHNNLGILLGKMTRTDEALAHFLKALELNPNNAEAHNNLGHLLADMGRTDEALAHYLKALEINPNYGEAHYNLGVLLSDMGRTDEALAHYLKAVEFNPHHVEAYNNLAVLLSDMGRTDEALTHFLKAVELNPDYAKAHNNLGILLEHFGRTDEAIAHYRKALELNPEATGALKNLAFALVRKGQWADAISVVQRALTLAKSAGDETRAQMIEQILTNLYEAIDSSKAMLKTRAQ